MAVETSNSAEIVLVNSSLETFTPTASGAIATVIHGQCRAAQGLGIVPWVLTRSASEQGFDWPRVVSVDYPRWPTGNMEVLFCRAERRVTGWRYLRQRQYAGRLLRALAESGLCRATLVLNNDPELAVAIRRRFPAARIAHLFHNQHGAKPAFRREFAASVDVVMAVSRFTADWVARHYGIEVDRVKVVPNGVDLAEFSPAPLDSPKADARPVIGFLGRTGIEKTAMKESVGPDARVDLARPSRDGKKGSRSG